MFLPDDGGRVAAFSEIGSPKADSPSIGTMSGLFFGLDGLGSALLGAMADRHGLPFVFHICSYLPLIGLLTALLPNLGTSRRPISTAASA